jgi:hypothetical protein
MSSFQTKSEVARVVAVSVSQDTLSVDLEDGRTVAVPLSWYPRLLHGSESERAHWILIGDGEGIAWPDLDEDISTEGILAGNPSGESDRSLQKWLKSRGR